MRVLIPILAFLAMAAVIACGPASNPESNENNPDGDPAATATATPTETPKDDGNPTKEPEPTETPKPSGEPTKESEPSPTPTRHPDDPPGATSIPTPTYVPVPTATPGIKPPSTDRNLQTPHPDGLAGCKSWNIFSSPADDNQYIFWCRDALNKDVADNCRSAEGTDAQLACGRGRMADVVDGPNGDMAACNAITDDDDRRGCFNEGYERFGTNMVEIQEFWLLIQQKVDSDPGVKERKIAVGDCMVDQGYERPDSSPPLPWQDIKDPPPKAERQQRTSEQIAVIVENHNAMDQCAIDVGLYDVQKELWAIEVNRLLRDEPEKARALKEHGLIAAMEMEGPPTFLHRRARRLSD